MCGHSTHELVKSVDYSDPALANPNSTEQEKSAAIQRQYATPDADGQVVGDKVDGKTQAQRAADGAAFDAAHPIDNPPPPDDPSAALVKGAQLAKRRRLLSDGGRQATFLTGGS